MLTDSSSKRTLPPLPPPPTTDTDRSTEQGSTEPGSKSEGEDEPPPPPAKRGLGRTPNHLTLRYQHMYGLASRTTDTLHLHRCRLGRLFTLSLHAFILIFSFLNLCRFTCSYSYICHYFSIWYYYLYSYPFIKCILTIALQHDFDPERRQHRQSGAPHPVFPPAHSVPADDGQRTR